MAQDLLSDTFMDSQSFSRASGNAPPHMAGSSNDEPTALTGATMTMLPAVDWDSLSRDELDTKINQFFSMCQGKGHPLLARRGPSFVPSAEMPYALNAAGIMKWILMMAGHIHNGRLDEEGLLFSAEGAEQVIVDRAFYFWEMYACYYRFQLQAAADSSASDLQVEKDTSTLQKLSCCYEVCERICNVQKDLHDLYRIMLNSSDFMVPECVTKSAAHISMLQRHGVSSEEKKRNDYQELFLFLLDCAAAHRYRKLQGIVYEEKMVTFKSQRYGTKAWEPANFGSTKPSIEASTVGAFISRFCRKETNMEMWGRWVNLRDGKKQLENHLSTCEDLEFPFLCPNRNIFAFQNGIYDSSKPGVGEFYSYEVASQHLPSNTVAVKYFDMMVDPTWVTKASRGRWWDVPTPLFQEILDYQHWGVGSVHRNTGRSSSDQMNMDDDDDEDDPATSMLGMLEAETEKLKNDMNDRIDSVMHELRMADLIDAETHMKQLGQCADSFKKTTDDLTSRANRAARGLDAELFAGQAHVQPPRRAAGHAFPVEAQKWVYIFLGRLLHKLGEYDSWQIIPFFKGKGGTGKSTVAHIAKSFFSANDVGVLSNNSEKKFGLQSLLGKLIFICFELKKNVSLDQAEFQSMVSGEEVSVAIKNQAAQTVRWEIPGLLCGNESPGWIDTQGSIARRLAIFSFRFKIAEKDSNPELLKHILGKELAAILIKCNAAYKDMAERHRGEDIWNLLPEYFKVERQTMQRDTDPLYNTIDDALSYELAVRDNIDIEDCFMPFEDFEQDYKRRHRDLRGNSYPDALTIDKYGSAFDERGLKLKLCEKTYNDCKRTEKWVIGIRPRRTPYVGAYDMV